MKGQLTPEEADAEIDRLIRCRDMVAGDIDALLKEGRRK
jgi:hypothetical protein